MIKNLTARVIKVQQGSKVASLEAANVVPHMLAPQETQSPQTNVKTMKSTNVEVSSKDLPTSSKNLKKDGRCAMSMGRSDVAPSGNPIEVASSKPKPEMDRTPLSSEQMKILFEYIKFEEGTAEWTEEQRHRVKSVIEKYLFLFAMNNLDLGRTDLIKHQIKLKDYTPIKDRYRRIPPHQYEEVRKHLKEMLDIGAIGRPSSP